ncbi:MAG TPA: hypothetical protein VEK79_12885 [Thermoanaerobaculia bacterium]|nr:hypothetical protein [Thermoanaerobaculia bacterium]
MGEFRPRRLIGGPHREKRAPQRRLPQPRFMIYVRPKDSKSGSLEASMVKRAAAGTSAAAVAREAS